MDLLSCQLCFCNFVIYLEQVNERADAVGQYLARGLSKPIKCVDGETVEGTEPVGFSEALHKSHSTNAECFVVFGLREMNCLQTLSECDLIKHHDVIETCTFCLNTTASYTLWKLI